MEDTILQQMVAEQWDRYRRADWKGRLDLLRHSFSMDIAHADDVFEFLHVHLDQRPTLRYQVNKAVAIDADHGMKGFARFVFALKEGDTKTFLWITADGRKEWILSRVANWAEDAFDACPCEEAYLRLRNMEQVK